MRHVKAQIPNVHSALEPPKKYITNGISTVFKRESKSSYAEPSWAPGVKKLNGSVITIKTRAIGQNMRMSDLRVC